MSAALQRIEEYFEVFCTAIDRCEEAPSFSVADWQDAYGRLGRLRERYEHEIKKANLTKPERDALLKVFENDSFIKGLMNIRHVSEHVEKREPTFTIRLLTNEPVEIACESSAMAMFAGPVVSLEDIDGQWWRIDHLAQLKEAKARIAKAIERAKNPR